MVKIEPNELNALTKLSSADCFQVRSVSENRFIRKIGAFDEMTMEKIRFALSKVLSIE
jgi:mRNA interferase MazF